MGRRDERHRGRRALPAVPRLRAHDWWICPACGRILPVTASVFPGPLCGDCYDGEP